MLGLEPSLQSVVRVAASVLPVATFLVSLTLLDSYKLVRPRALLIGLSMGVLAALVSLLINSAAIPAMGWSIARYSRYVAPPIEEAAKAAYLIAMIRTRRVGFVIDSAIVGFSIGAGFAVVENLYAMSVCDLTVGACILRGFGTAVMHGGTTALLGIATQQLAEERWQVGAMGLGWGFATAVVVHSLYNHFIVSPALATAGLVIVLPVLMYWAFQRSEKDLRSWLGIGFDTDAEMLEMVESGTLAGSRIGTYLSSLRDRFPPSVVADMFCLLRIRVELSVRAKGILLMRQAGFEAPVDPETVERFGELKYLERNIGRTGMLAMLPLLSWRQRDLWEMHMLTGRR